MARPSARVLNGRVIDHPILVVGGTGTTGRRVVSQLRAQHVPVRVASRSTETRFDWTDRSTWDAALDGVRSVYIVPLDGELITRSFVQRAVELGVERAVLLSGRGVDVLGYAGEAGIAGATHIHGESAVRNAGIAWTILRPTWFAQNFSEGCLLDAILRGELRLPAGDARAGFVDAEDIAAVAVAALTEDHHAEQTYELSGPRALSLDEAVAEIAEVTGSEIRYVPLSPGQFVAELTAQGWPAAGVESWVEAVSPLRRGLETDLADGVQRALGREPRDFTDFVKTAAVAGAWQN